MGLDVHKDGRGSIHLAVHDMFGYTVPQGRELSQPPFPLLDLYTLAPRSRFLTVE
jgi:hypothetical protein